jgi:hypothetical protein
MVGIRANVSCNRAEPAIWVGNVESPDKHGPLRRDLTLLATVCGLVAFTTCV